VSLLFVRELTASGDVILAFADDGSPVWALDRDSGLQWWYVEGERADVRRDIEENWASFGAMPITAASYAGPHPARELHRRAAAHETVEVPGPQVDEHPVVPWLRTWRDRYLRLTSPARILVVAAAVIVAFTLMSWVLSPFAAAPRPGTARDPGPPAAGAECTVRGETTALADGTVLVCAPVSRALSYQLVWRSTS
jgi:hypothetical protein